MPGDAHRYWLLSERVQTLSVALWGIDGRNGVLSKSREHQARLDRIDARLSAYDQTQMQIRTVWATLRWMGLGLFALIGFLLTTPVAEFVANIVRAGLAP
jgi:hypothetical protein